MAASKINQFLTITDCHYEHVWRTYPLRRHERTHTAHVKSARIRYTSKKTSKDIALKFLRSQPCVIVSIIMN